MKQEKTLQLQPHPSPSVHVDDSSVFTVEHYMTSEPFSDSDPVYMEIGDKSDGCEEPEDTNYSDGENHQKKMSVIRNSSKMSSWSPVYGTIIATEVAKYKPCSPIIIRK